MEDFVGVKGRIVGFDFDPKTQLYVPETFEQALDYLLKKERIGKLHEINGHIGKNTVDSSLLLYLRNAIIANTTEALDNLAPGSATVLAGTYDGYDGIIVGTAGGVWYVMKTVVSVTGTYYQDFLGEYDNTASGSAIAITQQELAYGIDQSIKNDHAIATGTESFSIAAYRKHWLYWKLTIAAA